MIQRGGKKASQKALKNLPVRKLDAKKAGATKGGGSTTSLLPAVQRVQSNAGMADGSVRPISGFSTSKI